MDLINLEHFTSAAAPDAFFPAALPEEATAVPGDSIASLMQMAEKMDQLLPLDLALARRPLDDPLLPPAAPLQMPAAPSAKPVPPALKLAHPYLSGWAEQTLPSAALSPCSVRQVASQSAPPHTPASSRARRPATAPPPGGPARRARVSKPVRKPKTYSKPVASRFCHICSRTPRRGHGAAVCARMRDGLCRKIVCEQCIREQGWPYESIMANPTQWHCPHCADACPPRSQCHIYNRINARRKRATPPAPAPAPVQAVPPPQVPVAPMAPAPVQATPAAAPPAPVDAVKPEPVVYNPSTLAFALSHPGLGEAPLADAPAAALFSWP